MQKHHLSEFFVEDKETKQLVPAKRKSQVKESDKEI